MGHSTPTGPPIPEPLSAVRVPEASPSPFLVGLRAARANLVPGLCLQALMLTVVFAFYRLLWARPWFDQLGALKQSSGYGFTVVSAVMAGAFLPEIFKWCIVQRRWPIRGDGAEILFAAGFYAVNAVCVDRLYRWQTLWFGADATPAVLFRKVFVDQFVYNPFFSAPFAVVCFTWKNHGYSVAPLRELLAPNAYVRRVLPTLAATWIVWIPVVAVLYSLPPLLQIPVYSLALCFWALMLAYIHAGGQNRSSAMGPNVHGASAADLSFPETMPMKPMKPMQSMKPMEPMKPMHGMADDPAIRWWPESLGTSPTSAGGQNEMRYAYFGGNHRLVIDSGSDISVYDTGEHEVSGGQQQQDGSGKKLVFSSQEGQVELGALKRVDL